MPTDYDYDLDAVTDRFPAVNHDDATEQDTPEPTPPVVWTQAEVMARAVFARVRSWRR